MEPTSPAKFRWRLPRVMVALFALALFATACVQQVAEQHNGSVSVSTTAGGGATFTLRIPTGGLSS